MTRTDTFYRASGTSPPDEDGVTVGSTSTPEPLPLPPELVEDLARLLADALVADIRQYPNLAELEAKRESTVESPSGLNRRRRSARARAAAQSGAACWP